MAGASKAWGITGAKSNCETLYFARDVIYQQTTDVNKKKNQKKGEIKEKVKKRTGEGVNCGCTFELGVN